jgi:hypothetical protein
MTRKSNYQNYQKLSYWIAGSLVFSTLMVVIVTIWGIYFDNWLNERGYHEKFEELIRNQERFNAPPFCIIPSVTTSFCFQYYILQVISSLKDPETVKEGETATEIKRKSAH